jgi:hypothetical protein
MATIQIAAADIKPGDIIQMNAQCAWRVEEILPGTDKVIKYSFKYVQNFGRSDAQIAEDNKADWSYKHRLNTKLKVHRG